MFQFHFSFLLAPEEGLPYNPKYRENLLNVFFCFIILFTWSSLCRPDQFVFLYVTLVTVQEVRKLT